MRLIEVKSVEKISDCTAIDRRTIGRRAISATASPSSLARKRRRDSCGSGSGRRMKSHETETTAKSTKAAKMPRQPARAMMPAPSNGASAGKIVKTIMTKDMSRAISRPVKKSRTMASDTMRGPAAPMPWMRRAATISSSDGARNPRSAPKM